jgi:hypothetical protein
MHRTQSEKTKTKKAEKHPQIREINKYLSVSLSTLSQTQLWKEMWVQTEMPEITQ